MNKTIDGIFFALLFTFALTTSSPVMGQVQGAPKLEFARSDIARSAQPSTTGDPDGPAAFSDWGAPVNIDNLGSTVNSSVIDQHPAISRNGLSLYFISDRTPGVGGQDIWVCKRASVNDRWGPPQNLGPVVNSSSTENAPALSPDEHLLFFASNRPGGFGGNDIWVSRRHNARDDFDWGPPVNLGAAINTTADEEGPTLFDDEESGSSVLYLTSNRPWSAADCNGPGVGDFDIYASRLQDDETFGPICLVRELSSPLRDTRTAIRRDGLEIFITSNRAGGQGLLDLWVATRGSTGAPWSTPVNLGSTVNSVSNDGAPALSFDGTTLYFYSNRPGGRGGNDLQVATRTKLQTVNPIDDAPYFVRQQYLDFLRREPDTDGLAFWTNQITSCGGDAQCIEVKRINVSAAFFLSIEFQQSGYLVYRFYKSSFGNLPNLPVPIKRSEFRPDALQVGRGVIVGQAGWETVLENNKQSFASQFVQRSRFASAYPTSMTPEVFVDTLFANAGVVPSGTDRSVAISEFGLATTTADAAARARALRRVAENSTLAQQEFNRAFVLMQYFGYLTRNPDDAPEATLDFQGYNFWLTKLNFFNGNFANAEMVKAFVTSGEYRQRFGQ